MTAVAITGIICLTVCWMVGYMVEDEQRRREHEERMAELKQEEKCEDDAGNKEKMTNLEKQLDCFRRNPESLANRLSTVSCEHCSIGCKAYCHEMKGNKNCAGTILEWLNREAPSSPYERY